MTLRRLLPGGIATRIALLLLVALFATQGISGLLYYTDRMEHAPLRGPGTLPHRIVTITTLLDGTPGPARAEVARAVGGPGLAVEWLPDRPVGRVDRISLRADILRSRLRALLHDPNRKLLVDYIPEPGRGNRTERSTPWEPPAPGSFPVGPILDEPAGDDGAVRAPPGPPPATLVVAVSLSDGSWVEFTTPRQIDPTFRLVRFGLWMLSIGLMIVLLSWGMARRLAAPLARFAAAAERLGRDVSAPPMPEIGPSEVRKATVAFNRMQERLQRYIEDRTQMLAAISHDLRTPLTRLRLRAEFIDDAEQQRKMMEDLDQMEAMISATLAFARDDARSEPQAELDLAALLQSLCDDAADAGHDAGYDGPEHHVVACRPMALRRAVGNLLDNALSYGGNARVSLVHLAGRAPGQVPGQVVVRIDDDGPGIPPSEQERVFAPFYRLERSRSRDTGGTGLGLAVARTFARAQGGDVRLFNRPDGGLRVELSLPDDSHLTCAAD